MRSVDVRVTGDVQGVSYRAYCARAAREHGVCGTVENGSDGSVLVHLEGPDDAVEAMVGWCRHGSPYATVVDVRVSEAAPTGATGFTILR